MSPPGWYPDPGGAPGRFRYWDGHQWSPQTASAPGSVPQGARSQDGSSRAWLVALVVLLAVTVLIVVVVLVRTRSTPPGWNGDAPVGHGNPVTPAPSATLSVWVECEFPGDTVQPDGRIASGRLSAVVPDGYVWAQAPVVSDISGHSLQDVHAVQRQGSGDLTNTILVGQTCFQPNAGLTLDHLGFEALANWLPPFLGNALSGLDEGDSRGDGSISGYPSYHHQVRVVDATTGVASPTLDVVAVVPDFDRGIVYHFLASHPTDCAECAAAVQGAIESLAVGP
ncbi:MAG: DUF2510 domain-containing protein [Actinomycetia bacterium]|nr:DUF2510 domain-containing protein [Actinomycetes bacterium]